MKKFLVLMSVMLTAIMVLCSCGGNGDNNNNGTGNPSDNSNPDSIEGKWVAYVQETGQYGSFKLREYTLTFSADKASETVRDQLSFDTMDKQYYSVFSDYVWNKVDGKYSVKSSAQASETREQYTLDGDRLVSVNKGRTYYRNEFESDATFKSSRLDYIVDSFETVMQDDGFTKYPTYVRYDFSATKNLTVTKSIVPSLRDARNAEVTNYTWEYDERYDMVWITLDNQVRQMLLNDGKFDNLSPLHRNPDSGKSVVGKWWRTFRYNAYTADVMMTFEYDGTATFNTDGDSLAFIGDGLRFPDVPYTYTWEYSAALDIYILKCGNGKSNIVVKIDNDAMEIHAVDYNYKRTLTKSNVTV